MEIYTLDAVVADEGDAAFYDYRTVAICLSVDAAKQIVAPFYTKKVRWTIDHFGHTARVRPIWQLDEAPIIGWCISSVDANSLFSEITMAQGQGKEPQ